MCADTCKDAQRKIIMAEQKRFCKHFLLLCNIFIYIAINKLNKYYKSIT